MDKAPEHLLRLFGVRQNFYHYIPYRDYLAGPSNLVIDTLSQDFSLTWVDLMSSLESIFPSNSDYQVWEPSTALQDPQLRWQILSPKTLVLRGLNS